MVRIILKAKCESVSGLRSWPQCAHGPVKEQSLHQTTLAVTAMLQTEDQCGAGMTLTAYGWRRHAYVD